MIHPLHPIPSRPELIDLLEKAGKPLKVKAIMSELGLKGERMRDLLEDRLEPALGRLHDAADDERRTCDLQRPQPLQLYRPLT